MTRPGFAVPSNEDRVGRDKSQDVSRPLDRRRRELRLSSPGGESRNGSFWNLTHALGAVPGVFHTLLLFFLSH